MFGGPPPGSDLSPVILPEKRREKDVSLFLQRGGREERHVRNARKFIPRQTYAAGKEEKFHREGRGKKKGKSPCGRGLRKPDGGGRKAIFEVNCRKGRGGVVTTRFRPANLENKEGGGRAKSSIHSFGKRGKKDLVTTLSNVCFMKGGKKERKMPASPRGGGKGRWRD